MGLIKSGIYTEITSLNAPTSAQAGEKVLITLNYKNIGPTQRLEWRAFDYSGGNYYVLQKSGLTLISSGNTVSSSFYITMPNHDLILRAATYNESGQADAIWQENIYLPCIPNWSWGSWSPDPSTVCNGVPFIQYSTVTDLAGCESSYTDSKTAYGTKIDTTFTVWSPDQSTVCSGESFTQTRTGLVCGDTESRTSNGTKIDTTFTAWSPDPYNYYDDKLFTQTRNGLECGDIETQEVYGTIPRKGDGTQAHPYIITDVDELQAMNNNLNAWYELGNNIDASDTINWHDGKGFDPISNNIYKFTGRFDGKGYTITGLYINRPGEKYVSLFGVVAYGVEIKKVGLVDINITGLDYIGSLAGYSFGVITNSYSTGSVTGSRYNTGGLVGINNGTITNSYSTASVNGYQVVGGLVGQNAATITNSYSTGSVSGSIEVGGLVGRNSLGAITNSYSTGSISGNIEVGGLVGRNEWGNWYNSFWDTDTSGRTTSACGIGKTTEDMKKELTFTNWDFNIIWAIDEEVTYPYFIWEVREPTPEGVGTITNIDAPDSAEFNQPISIVINGKNLGGADNIRIELIDVDTEEILGFKEGENVCVECLITGTFDLIMPNKTFNLRAIGYHWED